MVYLSSQNELPSHIVKYLATNGELFLMRQVDIFFPLETKKPAAGTAGLFASMLRSMYRSFFAHRLLRGTFLFFGQAPTTGFAAETALLFF